MQTLHRRVLAPLFLLFSGCNNTAPLESSLKEIPMTPEGLKQRVAQVFGKALLPNDTEINNCLNNRKAGPFACEKTLGSGDEELVLRSTNGQPLVISLVRDVSSDGKPIPGSTTVEIRDNTDPFKISLLVRFMQANEIQVLMTDGYSNLTGQMNEILSPELSRVVDKMSQAWAPSPNPQNTVINLRFTGYTHT